MKSGPVKKLFLGVSYTVDKDEEGLWLAFIDYDNAMIESGLCVTGCKFRWQAIQVTEKAIEDALGHSNGG